jgi:Flp pilus assembly protein TadD
MRSFALLFLVACSSISDSERRAQAFLTLGSSHIRENRFPQAIEALEESKKLDDSNSDVYRLLSIAYDRSNRVELAEKFLQEGLEIDSKNPEMWNTAASFFLTHGRAKEAEAAARKTLNYPTYSSPDLAWTNLALALQEQKRTKEALSASENALKIDPQKCPLLLVHAKILIADASFEEALEESRSARRYCASWPAAHMWEAYSLYKLGQHKAAKAKYLDIVSLFGQGPASEEARIALRRMQQKIPLNEPSI